MRRRFLLTDARQPNVPLANGQYMRRWRPGRGRSNNGIAALDIPAISIRITASSQDIGMPGTKRHMMNKKSRFSAPIRFLIARRPRIGLASGIGRGHLSTALILSGA
jgi:hypothetical protein